MYSNNKPRYKRLWKFLVLYGISRQPIVGARHPAPTLLSIFLLCTLLAEHTQTCCSEREEERREKKGGERRRGEVLILCNWGATLSQLTCRRPGIKRIPFSLSAILGLTACRAPRSDRPNWGLSPSAHLSHSIQHPFLACVLTHTVHTQVLDYSGFTLANIHCIFGIYNQSYTKMKSLHCVLYWPQYIYFKYLLSHWGILLYQGTRRFCRNRLKWQHRLF